MSNIIIIDSDINNYVNFIDNAIPITPFDPIKRKEDRSTLILLERYLVQIRTVADVR